jgi:aspartate/methionine/tyrosine aminotransferase
MTLLESLRTEARTAPESGIVAVMNHGRKREGIIPLWAGEGDLPTPDFIRKAGADALQAGETFYTWQRGIPELRQALARYHNRHFSTTLTEDSFLVTGSGMQSIQLALQAVAGFGDEVVYLSPAWPNFSAAAGIASAKAIAVQMDASASGWSLDIEKLKAAITSRTKAIFINSPSNPTGWTADREMLSEILELARKHGVWIIADEIYALFSYSGQRAPSFLDVMDPLDRVIFVNSFSKNWAMTGWRIGWLTVHPSLAQVFENLIQYSTSGVAQFMQKGAVAALDLGDDFIDMQVVRAKQARDILCDALSSTGKAQVTPPDGAFYLFFGLDGVRDSMAAAFSMVDQANIGIAPGVAFGDGAESYFRICFNRKLDDIHTAADRLVDWVVKNV